MSVSRVRFLRLAHFSLQAQRMTAIRSGLNWSTQHFNLKEGCCQTNANSSLLGQHPCPLMPPKRRDKRPATKQKRVIKLHNSPDFWKPCAVFTYKNDAESGLLFQHEGRTHYTAAMSELAITLCVQFQRALKSFSAAWLLAFP